MEPLYKGIGKNAVVAVMTVVVVMEFTLTLKQLVDMASEDKENAMAPDAVRESLCRLLRARYVERCLVPEAKIVEEKENDKKACSKKARVFKVPEEHRVVEAAKCGDMIRFSLTAYTGCSSDGDTKLADISVAENVAKEESFLWRGNFEEFIRYLRDKEEPYAKDLIED